jgi:hypothetical protein
MHWFSTSLPLACEFRGSIFSATWPCGRSFSVAGVPASEKPTKRIFGRKETTAYDLPSHGQRRRLHMGMNGPKCKATGGDCHRLAPKAEKSAIIPTGILIPRWPSPFVIPAQAGIQPQQVSVAQRLLIETTRPGLDSRLCGNDEGQISTCWLLNLDRPQSTAVSTPAPSTSRETHKSPNIPQ